MPRETRQSSLAAAIQLRRITVAWDSALQQYGVTLAQASILMSLMKEGEQSLGDLARTEGVIPAVIIGVVDRLERAGLLRRGPGPGDRRVTYARITEAGRQLLGKIELELPYVVA